MAVSAKLYGSVIGKLANKEIDLDTDTVKVALCVSTYSPNQDTHEYFDDVTNEISDTGYTAGGATLANKVITYTGGTNTFKFTADPTSWEDSTITARYAIIYVATGVAGTSPLVAYVDFGADVESTVATFLITWNASGIFTVTVS